MKREDIINLGEETYGHFLRHPIGADGRPAGQKGILHAMGLGHWVDEFGSYRPDTDFWGRRYIIDKAKKVPFGDRLVPLLRAIWKGEIPRLTGVPDKTEWLKIFWKTEGDRLSWGLEDTRGRDDLFKHHHKFFFMEIFNGSDPEPLFGSRIEPLTENAWGGTFNLSELEDDDLRLKMGYGKMGWFRYQPRMMGLTKFQDIGLNPKTKKWEALGWQGQEWTGEYSWDENDDLDEVELQKNDDLNERHRDKKEALALNKNGEFNPPDRDLIETARRYYQNDRYNKKQRYGLPWYRVLIAFRSFPLPYWAGVTERPTKPWTLAECRLGESRWDGWTPFRKEFERLGLE